jgi:hypothetical protein
MALAIYAYEAETTKETKSVHNGDFRLTYDQSQNKIVYAPEDITSNQFYNKTEVDSLIAGEGIPITAGSGINVSSVQGSLQIGTKINTDTLTYDNQGAITVIDNRPDFIAEAGVNITSTDESITIGTKVDNVSVKYNAQGALMSISTPIKIAASPGITVTEVAESQFAIGTKVDNETITYDNTGALRVPLVEAQGINIQNVRNDIVFSVKADNETIGFNANNQLTVINNYEAGQGITINQTEEDVKQISAKVDGTTITYDESNLLTVIVGSGDSKFKVVPGIKYDDYIIVHGVTDDNLYFIQFNNVPLAHTEIKVFRYVFYIDLVDESGNRIKSLYSTEIANDMYDNPVLMTVELEDRAVWSVNYRLDDKPGIYMKWFDVYDMYTDGYLRIEFVAEKKNAGQPGWRPS